MNEASEDVEDEEVVLSVRRLSPIANLTFRGGDWTLGLRNVFGVVCDSPSPGCTLAGDALTFPGFGRRFFSFERFMPASSVFLFALPLLESALPSPADVATIGFSCLLFSCTTFFPVTISFSKGFSKPSCFVSMFLGSFPCPVVFGGLADVFDGLAVVLGVLSVAFDVLALVFGVLVLVFGALAIVFGTCTIFLGMCAIIFGTCAIVLGGYTTIF